MISKDLEEFSNDKRGRYGKCTWCKSCTAEYKKKNKKRANELNNLHMQDPEYHAKVRARDRAWRRDNPQLHLYRSAKTRAKRKGIEFNIDLEDVIIPDKCPLLGCEFIPGTKDNYKYSYSLDRIDSTKGYVKGNVWVISSIANTMKNDATISELLIFSSNIQKHFDDIVRST